VNENAAIWFAIIGIGLTGVLTRCSFLLFGESLILPSRIEKALRLAPAAALAATVAPSILILDAGPLAAATHPRFIAAVVAALVMWRSRQMLWSMMAGIAAYTAIRLLLPA
jgi:branched-subunit amino acid transport protein